MRPQRVLSQLVEKCLERAGVSQARVTPHLFNVQNLTHYSRFLPRANVRSFESRRQGYHGGSRSEPPPHRGLHPCANRCDFELGEIRYRRLIIASLLRVTESFHAGKKKKIRSAGFPI